MAWFCHRTKLGKSFVEAWKKTWNLQNAWTAVCLVYTRIRTRKTTLKAAASCKTIFFCFTKHLAFEFHSTPVNEVWIKMLTWPDCILRFELSIWRFVDSRANNCKNTFFVWNVLMHVSDEYSIERGDFKTSILFKPDI